MSGSFVPLHFTFDDLPKKPKLQIQTVYGPITPHEIELVAAAFRLVIAQLETLHQYRLGLVFAADDLDDLIYIEINDK